MLSDLKTRTKVVAGFGVMLSILAALGVVGYVMFSKVHSNVTGLTDHSLSAVGAATKVRGTAFEILVAEKNYMLYKKLEFHEQVKQKLTELSGELDQVDQVATRFNDTELAHKSKEMRRLTDQFNKHYDEAVAALKSSETASNGRAAQGSIVQREADTYLAAKEAEYREAMNALAIANSIASFTWQTRYDRRKLEYERDPQLLDAVVRDCENLLARYEQLEKMHPGADEKRLIGDARIATRAYLRESRQFAAEVRRGAKDEALREMMKKYHQTGSLFGKAADNYLASKKGKVDKIADAMFIVADIAEVAPTSRLAARKYEQTRDPAQWKKMTESIAKLLNRYEDLRKVSSSVEDQQKIDRAEIATKDYLASAIIWATDDKRLTNVIIPEMRKRAEAVLATASAAEQDAWKASDAATNAVLGIVGTSKSIIVVTLIVGVVAVVVLGFFISKSISKVLGTLVSESTRLSKAAVEGKFQTRGNPELVSLEFRPIVAGLNAVLDTVVDKIYWLEQLLDAIPFPISVTDLDMNWTFINKPVEQFLGVTRKDMLGKQCSNWGAGICKTENCGICKLRKNQPQTLFQQQGMSFQVDTAFVYNPRGEKVGHIEVVQDITAKAKAADFQKEHVARVSQGLEQLAIGDLSFDVTVEAGDQYTVAERESFLQISARLLQARDAMKALVDDVHMLSDAAVEGRLAVRVDASKHQGDFHKIVQGVNDTLDSVVDPLNDAAKALKAMAAKDFTKPIETDYAGEITGLIKESTQQVEQGAHLSDETGDALKKIVESVKATAAKIAEIATATVQQAANSEEVSRATEGIAQVTEQSAAGTEQMASSSQELGAQAQVLRDLVGAFRTNSRSAHGESPEFEADARA
jgi:methyl-accepting chemotaxis protein